MNQNIYTCSYINKTLGYSVIALDIIKGIVMTINVVDIPAKTGTPYNWNWTMREEPAFASGVQDWSSGTLIQTDSGSLASITSTSFTTTANIPILASQFNVGKSFSLELVITDPDTAEETVVNQSVFTVVTASPDPNSPTNLLTKKWNHGEIVLTNANLTAINFGGSGLDLTTLTNANYDNTTPSLPATDSEAVKLRFFGRQLAGDGLTYTEYTLTGGVLSLNSADSNFVDGELLRWRYIGQS